VQALSDDLGRYLRREPVQARPETWRYVATRYLQRNAATVAAVVLVVGGVAGLVAYYTAKLSAERDAARVEAAKADQIAAFMMELFEVSDPWQSQGGSVTARELLDRGAARVSSELTGQPEVQARIEAFLEDAPEVVIPHRSNRAVMFHSNLFHRSDRFAFADEFESRRINISLLFGRRQRDLSPRDPS